MFKSLVVILLSVVLGFGLGGVALAQTYSWYLPVTVGEFLGTSVSWRSVLVDLPIQNTFVALGFIDLDGLDTRMREVTTDRPYTQETTRLGLTIPSLTAYQEKQFSYLLGTSSNLDSFDIIVGSTGNISSSGNITVVDSVELEISDNFTIEVSGGFETTSGPTKNIVGKEGAFFLRVSPTVSGNITAEVVGGANVTAIGISSGEYIVTVSANTTHLWISIDEDVKDVASLASGAPDTADNWTFCQNSVMSHIRYIKIWID